MFTELVEVVINIPVLFILFVILSSHFRLKSLNFDLKDFQLIWLIVIMRRKIVQWIKTG